LTRSLGIKHLLISMSTLKCATHKDMYKAIKIDIAREDTFYNFQGD